MKSHIFSGKFVPQPESEIEQYAWLTREEIQELVHPE